MIQIIPRRYFNIYTGKLRNQKIWDSQKPKFKQQKVTFEMDSHINSLKRNSLTSYNLLILCYDKLQALVGDIYSFYRFWFL